MLLIWDSFSMLFINLHGGLEPICLSRRSYGISVDEWSDQPLVAALFFRLCGKGLRAKNPTRHFLHFLQFHVEVCAFNVIWSLFQTEPVFFNYLISNALTMTVVASWYFVGTLHRPIPVRCNGSVFARKMHSATEFVMTVLSKCVTHVGSARCREPFGEYLSR